MKNIYKINFLVIVTLLFSFGFCTKTFAQATSTTSLINAEILNNVWYSTTTINEGDNINIYAGFQNHYNKNLSGTAGFFVDGVQIGKEDFTANSKSLIKLETKYTAVRGEHTVQVKILDIDNLLASETEKKSLSVKYQITTIEIMNNVQNVTNNVIDTVDVYAQKAADYVESLKQPTENTATTNNNNFSVSSPSNSTTQPKTLAQIAQEKLTGQVLGTSTENIRATETQNNIQKDTTSWKTYFHNLFLDILAFLLRRWVWTFIAILLFILYLTLK